jgi:hypothetical protein
MIGFMTAINFFPKALFFCALSTLAVSGFGATISLNSSASETTNNSGAPTLNIDTNPAWAAAMNGSSWVSNVQSGNPADAGYVSPPNGTDVLFTDTFTINGTPTSGSVQVRADDTAAVFLNGVNIMPFATTVNNTYYRCSDYPVGCSAANTAVISLTAQLKSGVNVLTFSVEQLHEVSYGLDYSGTVTYTPAVTATPEPATFALLGLPLLALGVIGRKRKA